MYRLLLLLLFYFKGYLETDESRAKSHQRLIVDKKCWLIFLPSSRSNKNQYLPTRMNHAADNDEKNNNAFVIRSNASFYFASNSNFDQQSNSNSVCTMNFDNVILKPCDSISPLMVTIFKSSFINNLL